MGRRRVRVSRRLRPHCVAYTTQLAGDDDVPTATITFPSVGVAVKALSKTPSATNGAVSRLDPRGLERQASSLTHLADMIPQVLHDEPFLDQVLRALSITVTEMFRDPPVYLALRVGRRFSSTQSSALPKPNGHSTLAYHHLMDKLAACGKVEFVRLRPIA